MEATAPVTVEQAAAILGVSPSTVHRRIRSGALRAERAVRPQGAVWLVHLSPDSSPPTAEPPPPVAVEATGPVGAAAQAEAMALLIRETVMSVLEPLRADLATAHDRIGMLERENGTLTERLAAAERSQTQQEARTAARSVEPTADTRMTVWARWAPLGLSLLAVVLALGLLIWLR